MVTKSRRQIPRKMPTATKFWREQSNGCFTERRHCFRVQLECQSTIKAPRTMRPCERSTRLAGWPLTSSKEQSDSDMRNPLILPAGRELVKRPGLRVSGGGSQPKMGRGNKESFINA